LTEGIDIGRAFADRRRMANDAKKAAKAAEKEAARKAKYEQEARSFVQRYRELVSAEEIIEAGARLGVVERRRKVDLPALVEATVTALSPVPGVQTTILQSYLALTGQDLARSSFYDRFTEPFADLIRELAVRAVRAVREAEPRDELAGDLGVLLEQFTDVRVADSTTHLLKRLARGWAPSTSKTKLAGVKLHAVFSLRDHLPVEQHITAQRVHDNKAFPEWTMEPGTLSLFDLGYIDVERFIAAIVRGAHFLTRLKTNHNPKIVRVHVGKGSRRAARGLSLDDALEQRLLEPDKGVIDIDVLLTSGDKEAAARVVGIENDNGVEMHWYLTSVGRDVLDARDVAEAYRLRWVIELLWKQLKSGAGLDTILAWRESAVHALVHAKIVALCLARMLELSVLRKDDDALQTRLALMLVLTRAAPLLHTIAMMSRGVTLEQLEERIELIAIKAAQARNQRRERARRKREADLGRCH